MFQRWSSQSRVSDSQQHQDWWCQVWWVQKPSHASSCCSETALIEMEVKLNQFWTTAKIFVWRKAECWSVICNMAQDKINQELEIISHTAFNQILLKVGQFTNVFLLSSSLLQDNRITEDEFILVVRVLATNGANLHFPSPEYGSAVGVYPFQAYLNHNCRFD